MSYADLRTCRLFLFESLISNRKPLLTTNWFRSRRKSAAKKCIQSNSRKFIYGPCSFCKQAIGYELEVGPTLATFKPWGSSLACAFGWGGKRFVSYRAPSAVTYVSCSTVCYCKLCWPCCLWYYSFLCVQAWCLFIHFIHIMTHGWCCFFSFLKFKL